MMKKAVSYISKEKKKALEKELEQLRGPKRKEVLEAVQIAKSMGDLSENAEYHEARADQARLESRILEVESILRSSVVVSNNPKSDTITFGSTVCVKREGDRKEYEYIVVGSEEADMAEGKVSNTSPIGEALFGKKKGDKIAVKTPAGETHYKITKVS